MSDSKVNVVSRLLSADQRTYTLEGTVQFTAGSYVTGGLPVNFGPFVPVRNPVPTTCIFTSVQGATGSPPTSVKYFYAFNAASQTIQVFQSAAENASAAPFAELPASALPFGVELDLVWVFARFPRQ